MLEEYFDLLDDNGNPTGKTVSRSDAHAQGLWHRTVHIYIFRKSKNGVELLVHLRAKNKDLNPDMLDTRFGGHLKAGETIEEALVSELRDEIGITASVQEMIAGPIRKRNNFPNNEFTSSYFYEFRGNDDTLKFNDGEVQEIKWMNVEDILQSMKVEAKLWSGRATSFEEIKDMLLKTT